MNELVARSICSLLLRFLFDRRSKRLCAFLGSTQPAFFGLDRRIKQVRIASNWYSEYPVFRDDSHCSACNTPGFDLDSGLALPQVCVRVQVNQKDANDGGALCVQHPVVE